jgi:hypothetical protein
MRRLLLALAVLAGCSHNPGTEPAENFRGAIQAYFDHQPPVAATLSFSSRNLFCPPRGCPEEERERLNMLLKVGLLAVLSQSAEGTIYRVTPQGTLYLHPRIVAVMSSSDTGQTEILGYSVAEGRTVVAKIDSYTKIGTDAEGAQSTTVWFVAENQPYNWVSPYVAQEESTTHLGQSTSGKARLVLTNKGWRVTGLSIDWPQVSQLDRPLK